MKPHPEPSVGRPSRVRKYDDAALAKAIAASHSWRGVIRLLDVNATSGSMIRSVRRRADQLGFDYSHFTGMRGWRESDLAEAVAESGSWGEVAMRLGLAAAESNEHRLKGHARRLGLDSGRLQSAPTDRVPSVFDSAGQVDRLRRAGSMLAAAWFELRGHDVAWPLEPCSYDLLVTVHGTAQRVQVKTTQCRAGSTWRLSLTNSRREGVTYDPDEIDFFFGIDGDFGCYLIPVGAVGGLRAIHLSHYAAYRVSGLQSVA